MPGRENNQTCVSASQQNMSIVYIRCSILHWTQVYSVVPIMSSNSIHAFGMPYILLLMPGFRFHVADQQWETARQQN